MIGVWGFQRRTGFDEEDEECWELEARTPKVSGSTSMASSDELVRNAG